MDRILLIDGLNSMWRANITFKPGEKKEEPSFVMVYNFFRNLRATIEQFDPAKVFFCLEGNNNFRYKIYSEYKANRIIKTGVANEKSTEDFHRQKNIILDLLHHLPITVVKADEFECDDVIATLADNLKEEEVIILSNDSDFVQLLQKGYKNLRIYNPFKKDYMVAPDYHYLTWKCLAGDKKTDNIPGLVGPKKAEKLARDIDEFVKFFDSQENKSNYSLNKSLIELRMVSDESLQFFDYNINYELLREQFARMDMPSMIEDKYWDRFCKTFSNLR